MTSLGRNVAALPRPVRWCVVGTVAVGLVGCVVGLVLGLRAYPPTAWAAVFEVGVPAGCVGGLLGLVAGLVAQRIDGWRAARG
ncbi:hypothetical protein [Nocardioides terrisoli]|uniref:hypothetical protein n=1 Tax=Nocardioides terrisoli TaxID=3388267 RepID=UPI00287BB3F0|nr:hypothetical protein [Nocardioides marmorisolisilvae]